MYCIATEINKMRVFIFNRLRNISELRCFLNLKMIFLFLRDLPLIYSHKHRFWKFYKFFIKDFLNVYDQQIYLNLHSTVDKARFSRHTKRDWCSFTFNRLYGCESLSAFYYNSYRENWWNYNVNINV